jgi:hypothetical protein
VVRRILRCSRRPPPDPSTEMRELDVSSIEHVRDSIAQPVLSLRHHRVVKAHCHQNQTREPITPGIASGPHDARPRMVDHGWLWRLLQAENVGQGDRKDPTSPWENLQRGPSRSLDAGHHAECQRSALRGWERSAPDFTRSKQRKGLPSARGIETSDLTSFKRNDPK